MCADFTAHRLLKREQSGYCSKITLQGILSPLPAVGMSSYRKMSSGGSKKPTWSIPTQPVSGGLLPPRQSQYGSEPDIL